MVCFLVASYSLLSWTFEHDYLDTCTVLGVLITTIMMIIIIIIIIIIIAFKGAVRFFTISSLCREPSPTHTLKCPVQITWNTSTCRVTCHMVRRDSSAIKLDRLEIAFILALFYWLNQCLPCMCCIFLYVCLFSATEHVSHGKSL